MRKFMVIILGVCLITLASCSNETPEEAVTEREIPIHEDINLNQYTVAYFDKELCTLRLELDGESFDEVFYCISAQKDYKEEFYDYFFHDVRNNIFYVVTYSRVIFGLELQYHVLDKNEVLWKTIANQEFTADNGWAGEGLYFYGEDAKLYCDWMIYGSGLRVAGISTFEVTLNNDGNVVLWKSNGDMLYTKIVLTYENNNFLWKDLIFEDIDLNFHPDIFVDSD